jgi:hypothetical protein
LPNFPGRRGIPLRSIVRPLMAVLTSTMQDVGQRGNCGKVKLSGRMGIRA